MANIKISQLTNGTPAQPTDDYPISRGGTNFRVRINTLLSMIDDGNGNITGSIPSGISFENEVGSIGMSAIGGSLSMTATNDVTIVGSSTTALQFTSGTANLAGNTLSLESTAGDITLGSAGDVIIDSTGNVTINATASQALILQSALSGSSIKIAPHDSVFGLPLITLNSATTGQTVISWAHNGSQDFALYHHGSGAVLGIFDNSVNNDAFTIFGGLTSLRDLAIGGAGVLNGRVRLFGSTSGAASRAVNATATQVVEDTPLQVPALNITSLGVHANNAAAILAGLVIGDLYRTGADPDVVCIVH